MYLLTHAYFCLYHALSNMLIRRTLAALAKRQRWLRLSTAGVLVLLLAYATAFMEALTIAHVRLLASCVCTNRQPSRM